MYPRALTVLNKACYCIVSASSETVSELIWVNMRLNMMEKMGPNQKHLTMKGVRVTDPKWLTSYGNESLETQR